MEAGSPSFDTVSIEDEHVRYSEGGLSKRFRE